MWCPSCGCHRVRRSNGWSALALLHCTAQSFCLATLTTRRSLLTFDHWNMTYWGCLVETVELMQWYFTNNIWLPPPVSDIDWSPVRINTTLDTDWICSWFCCMYLFSSFMTGTRSYQSITSLFPPKFNIWHFGKNNPLRTCRDWAEKKDVLVCHI